MAKKQDFLSKTMKKGQVGNKCPKCESTISYIRFVKTEKSKKTNSWRFNQKNVGVCKCNENEIYG
jgi:hypothetical protein